MDQTSDTSAAEGSMRTKDEHYRSSLESFDHTLKICPQHANRSTGSEPLDVSSYLPVCSSSLQSLHFSTSRSSLSGHPAQNQRNLGY
jgi:hypothetical protein